MISIIELDQNYKGKKLDFSYLTDSYLDIEMTVEKLEPTFKFTKKKYPAAKGKKQQAVLLEDHWTNPLLYGILFEDEEAGYLELAFEDWNNRMRITNIFVYPEYRRQGIAGKLLEHAKKVAKEYNQRALVLETQSCNMPAIQLYLEHKFEIIGFDLTHYSNKDIANQEVRVEMGVEI